jgi:hypothetical protein
VGESVGEWVDHFATNFLVPPGVFRQERKGLSEYCYLFPEGFLSREGLWKILMLGR